MDHVLTAVAAALSSAPQPALPGFLNSLSAPLEHYGLWAIALLVLLEDFGIPVPGETVLIAGAVYAGSGRINVVALGVVGFAAAVVGDNIGYAIGRFGGRALVTRWGRYVFLTSHRLDRAEAFFNRQGGKIITVARFIEGLRQANGIIAGITEMHWLKFLAFNALGAALWVGTWVCAGYFAGQHITTVYHDVTEYSLYAAIAAVAAIAAWVLLRLRKRRGKKASAAVRAQPPGQPAAIDADAPHAAAADAGAARSEAGAANPPDTDTDGDVGAAGTGASVHAATGPADARETTGITEVAGRGEVTEVSQVRDNLAAHDDAGADEAANRGQRRG